VSVQLFPRQQTATVAELIDELKKHDPEMPVAYLWESQITPVVLSGISVCESIKNATRPVLLMDAET
jgi:hypothetical protein